MELSEAMEQVKQMLAENGGEIRKEFSAQLEEVKKANEEKFAELSAKKAKAYGSSKLTESEKKQMSADFYKALARKDKKKLKDLSEGTDSAGGYLVPEPIRDGILASATQYGLARRYATVVPMASRKLNVPRVSTEAAVSGIAEGAGYHILNEAFDNAVLEAKKFGGILKVTEELLADATPDIVSFINGTIGRIFAKAEDTEFFTGDGTFFTGILNDTATQEYTLASDMTTYASATLDDMALVQNLLDEGLDDGAVYVMNKSVLTSLMTQKASSAGTYLLAQPNGGAVTTIWNYPVLKSAVMPKTSDVSQANKPFAIYGNLKNYIFGDRKAISMRVLSERYSDEGKVGLRMDERFAVVGGLPADIVRVLTHA